MNPMCWSRRVWCLALVALPAYPQPAGPVVMLIGPPGAGKTTQSQILQKDLGMTVVSADDLIAQNRQAFEKYRRPNIQGVEPRVDPVLNRLVEEKLRAVNLTKGVILDGYPAAKIHGDYFTKLVADLRFPKPIVIHLLVPDDVVRKRLTKEKAEDVEQRLKDYHRELDFARLYFPEVAIHDVDGTKPPGAVAKEIRKVLKGSPKR